MTPPPDRLSELLALAEQVAPLKAALDAARADRPDDAFGHAGAYRAWRDARDAYERAFEPDVLAPLLRELQGLRAATTEWAAAWKVYNDIALKRIALMHEPDGDREFRQLRASQDDADEAFRAAESRLRSLSASPEPEKGA